MKENATMETTDQDVYLEESFWPQTGLSLSGYWRHDVDARDWELEQILTIFLRMFSIQS